MAPRRPRLLLIPVVYVVVVLVARLLTIGVVHFDRPLLVQLVVVPLVQMAALAAATTLLRWKPR